MMSTAARASRARAASGWNAGRCRWTPTTPMPSLLTLTDVMGTGTTRRETKVAPGKTVAVVGGGAVGLCGVIASKRLGADRISRQQLRGRSGRSRGHRCRARARRGRGRARQLTENGRTRYSNA
jgi:hypothetical protein